VLAASFSGEIKLLFGMNQSAPRAQRRRPRLVHLAFTPRALRPADRLAFTPLQRRDFSG
jgi:hypothetical protein